MDEKVILKTMRCPTCSGTLKAKNDTEEIVCLYCGNTIVPVRESTPAPSPAFSSAPMSASAGSIGGTVRVEGIKTPASALAYMEHFFEEYDWESFAYAQTLTIEETDLLAESLKVSSADDKNTWLVCFMALSIPYMRKIGGTKEILATLINEYRNDNLDAYGRFDAYKRITSMIVDSRIEMIKNLRKFVANAERYGASSEEIAGLNVDIESIVDESDITIYRDIESVPAIRAFKTEKNARIARELAAVGIDAESEYNRALSLMNAKSYAEALTVFLSLNGYSDSSAIAEKLDKYFLISNVLEIDGTLYCFKETGDDTQPLSLHPTKDGKISDKAIIGSIGQIITNYADILYYLDGNMRLKKYYFPTGKEETIYDKSLNKKNIFVYDRRAVLLTNSANSDNDIIELNLATGSVKPIACKVKNIVLLDGNKLVYTSTEICVLNLDSYGITNLGSKKLTVEGFVGNSVVYTQKSPNEFNKALYIRELGENTSAKLIEKNILSFAKIVCDKIFYFIGNTTIKSLINVNCDGTERREWPLYISDILFEQGGWLYFIKRYGYNSILCRSKLDGSRYTIIASDIEKFIEIKNGYLYYLNSYNTLIKVRMDGSSLEELCTHVEKVLSVKEDKIVFISLDGTLTDKEMQIKRPIKSIYAVDFSGSGKIKPVYDVADAQKYDDNAVYYLATETVTKENVTRKLNVLYKLDVETYNAERLLEMQFVSNSEISILAIAIIFTAMLMLFALAGFAADAPGFGAISLVLACLSAIVAVTVRTNKKE